VVGGIECNGVRRDQDMLGTGQTRIANTFEPGRNANHKERRYDAANFNKFLGIGIVVNRS